MYAEYRDNPDNSIEGWTSVFANTGELNLTARLKFRLNPVTRLIRAHLQSPILDAGCGAGEWAAFLNEQGYSVTGLDYSADMVARNKSRYPQIEWKTGDIRAMPFSADTFGGLISWGVIEHDQAGPSAALTEFRRVLKPGACCIVTVPVDNERQRLASEVQFGTQKDYFFQYFMTPDELAQAVKSVGFDIVHSDILPLSSPPMVAPRMYLRFQKSRYWHLFRLVTALAWGRRFGNMTVCIGRKPL